MKGRCLSFIDMENFSITWIAHGLDAAFCDPPRRPGSTLTLPLGDCVQHYQAVQTWNYLKNVLEK